MRWMKAVSLISRDTDDWVRVGSGSGSGQVRSGRSISMSVVSRVSPESVVVKEVVPLVK